MERATKTTTAFTPVRELKNARAWRERGSYIYDRGRQIRNKRDDGRSKCALLVLRGLSVTLKEENARAKNDGVRMGGVRGGYGDGSTPGVDAKL